MDDIHSSTFYTCEESCSEERLEDNHHYLQSGGEYFHVGLG